MPKFRERPRFVEAFLLTKESAGLIINWIRAHGGVVARTEDGALETVTRGGMRAMILSGDWVLQDRSGGFVAMSVGEFEGKYESICSHPHAMFEETPFAYRIARCPECGATGKAAHDTGASNQTAAESATRAAALRALDDVP